MNNLQQIKDRAARAKELADRVEKAETDIQRSANRMALAASARQDVPQLATDVLLLAEVVEGLIRAVEMTDDRLKIDCFKNELGMDPWPYVVSAALSTARERLSRD